MYHDELNSEAALIVRGREAYVRDAARAWARLLAWFGFTRG